MVIPFSCPHCALETLVDKKYAGQSGDCAGCGRPITVPPFSATQAARIRGRLHSVVGLIAIILAAIVAGGALLGLGIRVIGPAVGAAKDGLHRSTCQTNLARIAAALQQYSDQYGTYPPAYIADKNGKPMHSWRVLILPQLGEHHVYAKYDWSTPWNSPSNMELAKRMPRVYGCPSDPNGKGNGETSYMVLVGPDTLFPGAEAIQSFGDSPAETILVAETEVQGVIWLEPKDLAVASMEFQVNGRFGREISSSHRRGAHVAMADGRVHSIDHFVPDDLRAMSTRDGRERLPHEVFRH